MGNSPAITFSPSDIDTNPQPTQTSTSGPASFRTGIALPEQQASAAPITFSPSDIDTTPTTSAPAAQQPEDKTVLNDFGTMGKFLHDTGKDVGEGAVKTLNDIGGVVLNAPSSIWHQLPPVALVDSMKKTLPVINAYEKARASGASVGDAIKAADLQARQQDTVGLTVKDAADEFKKNPTRESVRALGDAAALAASIFAGGPEAALPEAAEGEAAAGATTATAPAKLSVPEAQEAGSSLYQKITKGEEVAQPQAQGAVKTAIANTADDAGITNNAGDTLRTALDQPITDLDQQASDIYKPYDKAAGIDFKLQQKNLSNAQYQLDNATTPEQEAFLQTKIDNITNTLEKAKQAVQDAGLDVGGLKQADQKFGQARAIEEFDSKVIQPNLTGNAAKGASESLNVDGAIKALEKMQKNTKYGPSRLEQAIGKDNASQLLDKLYEAQKAGKAALKVQSRAKWTAYTVGAGAATDFIAHLF